MHAYYHSAKLPTENLPCNASATGKAHIARNGYWKLYLCGLLGSHILWNNAFILCSFVLSYGFVPLFWEPLFLVKIILLKIIEGILAAQRKKLYKSWFLQIYDRVVHIGLRNFIVLVTIQPPKGESPLSSNDSIYGILAIQLPQDLSLMTLFFFFWKSNKFYYKEYLNSSR